METFPLKFAEPAWLALLALTAVVWLLGRRSLAGLPPWRRRCALALRVAIVAALALALARPQWNRAPDAVAVYFVVDMSDSVPEDQLRQARDFAAAVAEAKPKGDLVGLIYFGADATCEQPPTELPVPLERQGVIERGGTDIAGALRLAEATFPGGARKRIVLVSDGNQNQGDALAEAARLRERGLTLDVLPVEYNRDREILMEKAWLPGQAQVGLPFELRALVRSTHDADAVLTVRREGETQARVNVHLKTGRNQFSVPLVISDRDSLSGLRSYEVSVAPVRAEDDQLLDNNSAYAFTRVTGPPAVLYVDGNLGGEGYRPLLHEALLKGLRLFTGGGEPEVTLRLCDPYGMPDGDALAAYDCIILDNVPADAVGQARMERIRQLVNGQGVGLVMIGGDSSFGVGNYRATPIEQALPVDMDLKNRKVLPSGALVLVIDRSGSMEGDKLDYARQAAWAAARALSPGDQLGVLAFDSGADWLVPTMRVSTDRSFIKQRIFQLGSAGGTDIMNALSQAQAALAPLQAAVKHIVLLSDGQADNNDFDAIMGRMSAAGITVTSVGIGEPEGQRFMQLISQRGGGRYYYANDPSRLPRIFIKESMFVKRTLLVEDEFTPLVAQSGDEFLEGVRGRMPPLLGYVATSAKPAAEVPLTGSDENKDPVLAHWRYGLGRAVAFTSDAKNRWAKKWLEWEGFPEFWSGLVYRSLRQQPSNLRLEARIEDGGGKISATAVDENGRPLPFLDLAASVTGPDGVVERVRLRQTGVCTYEGDFPAGKAGRYEVAVVKDASAGGAPCAAYCGAARSLGAESETLSADPRMLARLADAGGGTVLTAADRNGLFRREGLAPAVSFGDRWKLLLALAALLFPLDVFTRRVMLDYGAMRRWLAARYAAWRGKPVERDEHVSRLMEAKRRALSGRPTPEFLDRTAENPAAPVGFAEFAPPPAPARPDAQPAAAPVPKAEPVEETYTSRLLKAKRRVGGKH